MRCGESALISETANSDPNNEDFCAFGTHRQCLGATWKDGTLTALPTLPGGNNDPGILAQQSRPGRRVFRERYSGLHLRHALTRSFVLNL